MKVEKSEMGYGFHAWLTDRIQYGSPKSIFRVPKIYRGGDEYCNPTLAIHLWPLGGIVWWYKRKQRTKEDGQCADCRTEYYEAGFGSQMCFFHGFEHDDPDAFKVCGECGHVWYTEEEFRQTLADDNEAWKHNPWGNGEIMFPDPWHFPVDEVYACPLCTHDF